MAWAFWRSASRPCRTGVGCPARPVAWLGRISYAVFLIHYPAALLVGAWVALQWQDDLAANMAGLGITWLISLAAGTLLHLKVERRAGRRAIHRPPQPAP